MGGDAEAEKKPIRVMVDPRIELVSLIFHLAGNPEYGRSRVDGYGEDIETYFESFKDHAVIRKAKTLRKTRGVSFDAPMSLAVYCTDAKKLEERVPFDKSPDGLDRRWPLKGAREFLRAAREFAKESRFQEFIAAHQPLYETAESRMKALLAEEAHPEWFGKFFGTRTQASFTVVLGMQNGGSCYGPHCRLPDGKEELYCILGVWETDSEGMPVFNAGMLGTVVHEFCHSYANPIIEQHTKELQAAGAKIFPQVASAMKRQAYGNWQTMMYESLVRACTARYIRCYQGEEPYQTAIRYERNNSFLWIEGLSGLLGEYEGQRDIYPTLDVFVPRIVAFFDEYAKEQKAP